LSDPANRVEISGVVTGLQALRHTPAGVPVIEFRLKHASERAEAGALRKVNQVIKDALDPNGILSPGKSGIWPSNWTGPRT